jgi:signal transduction histidine kinase
MAGEGAIYGGVTGFNEGDGLDRLTGAAKGAAAGKFDGPRGLVVSKAGQLFVADFSNHRVQVFRASDGAFLRQIGGEAGEGNGQFDCPMDVALSPDETELLVVDFGNHRIQVRGESEDGIRVAPVEFESAVRNLLTNAIRYTPEGGAIELSWSAGPGECRVTVRDSGIGIDAEHIPRLTERFYRVDRGRSRGNGGTGLGLAIVKHVLQRHDGHLEVESAPGKGSAFSLCLPKSRLVQPMRESPNPGQSDRTPSPVA